MTGVGASVRVRECASRRNLGGEVRVVGLDDADGRAQTVHEENEDANAEKSVRVKAYRLPTASMPSLGHPVHSSSVPVAHRLYLR